MGNTETVITSDRWLSVCVRHTWAEDKDRAVILCVVFSGEHTQCLGELLSTVYRRWLSIIIDGVFSVTDVCITYSVGHTITIDWDTESHMCNFPFCVI